MSSAFLLCPLLEGNSALQKPRHLLVNLPQTSSLKLHFPNLIHLLNFSPNILTPFSPILHYIIRFS